LLVLASAVSAISLAALAASLGSPPRAAAQAAPATSAPPELFASPRASEVVDAADTFLATLSDEQRAIAQIELKPSLAVRWTNFPGGSNVRNGVFYRELKPQQVEAALKVAQVALGEEGFARYQEVRAADDAFAKGRGGRGPGGPGPGGSPPKKAGGGPALKKGGGPGGGAMFGSTNYMIAFLGKPGTTSPSIFTTRGRRGRRPPTTSPRSRRCGRTTRAKRTSLSLR
jgi:hypothetical protein